MTVVPAEEAVPEAATTVLTSGAWAEEGAIGAAGVAVAAVPAEEAAAEATTAVLTSGA